MACSRRGTPLATPEQSDEHGQHDIGARSERHRWFERSRPDAESSWWEGGWSMPRVIKMLRSGERDSVHTLPVCPSDCGVGRSRARATP